MNLVLLPGMDGTGLLFQPFMAQAPNLTQIKPIPLRQVSNLSYAEQAEHVLGLINNEPTVIVAESYSGRIAYEIAQISPTRIKHIVFAASFLGRPSSIAKFAQLAPIGLFKGGILPRAVIGRLAFGSASSSQLESLLQKTLNEVEDSVLRYRLKQIEELENPSKIINIPCTYIRAKSDRLVSPKALDVFKTLCPNLEIKAVEGSHFILQTNPQDCWGIINRLLA